MGKRGDPGFEPAYFKLYQKRLLEARRDEALRRLRSCRLCPRGCAVNRLENEKGYCRTGFRIAVSSYSPHFGEEDPLVGSGGSGTIFFTHCNLYCVFCQNYEISHLGEGVEVSAEKLAQMMIELQKMGCHNINFVSPSHGVAQILQALPIAVARGLRIPLVYNTGGYDSLPTLQLLDGIFDIYMPDIKFMDPAVAEKYCQAGNYPEIVKEAIREMHRQVGDLVIDAQGVAQRGLLVRHLVLPEGQAGTREAMRFLAQEISPNTYVNIMAQYRPCGQAHRHPPLNRRISDEEYEEALRIAREEGIHRLDRRDGPRFIRLWWR